jgi:hypothetical protein
LRAALSFGPFKTFQVPVAQVGKITGLDFGRLGAHDPLGRPGLRAAPERRAGKPRADRALNAVQERRKAPMHLQGCR